MNLRPPAPAFHRPARVAALVALGLSACAPTLPPLARTGGDTGFKARIALAFPPGSPAAALRARLGADGFTLLEDPAARRFSAVDAPANLPCFSRTRIDWLEDARGRIVLIQAARQSCS